MDISLLCKPLLNKHLLRFTNSGVKNKLALKLLMAFRYQFLEESFYVFIYQTINLCSPTCKDKFFMAYYPWT